MPDFQLSLAIGKEGQNARLAARLTGWRIDIHSETRKPRRSRLTGLRLGAWRQLRSGRSDWRDDHEDGPSFWQVTVEGATLWLSSYHDDGTPVRWS